MKKSKKVQILGDVVKPYCFNKESTKVLNPRWCCKAILLKYEIFIITTSMEQGMLSFQVRAWETTTEDFQV